MHIGAYMYQVYTRSHSRSWFAIWVYQRCNARFLFYAESSFKQPDMICPSAYFALLSGVKKTRHCENLTGQLVARCIAESDSAKAMGVPNKLNDVTRG